MSTLDILRKNKVYLAFESNEDYIKWCNYMHLPVGYLTGMALRNNRCFISFYSKYLEKHDYNRMPSQLDSSFRRYKYRRIQIKSSWIKTLTNSQKQIQ